MVLCMESCWPHPKFTSSSPILLLLTSGEMEGISGGAAGDGCKEVGWSFPVPDSPGQKVEQAVN